MTVTAVGSLQGRAC